VNIKEEIEAACRNDPRHYEDIQVEMLIHFLQRAWDRIDRLEAELHA
jgi:hypothetical protein